MNTLHKNSITLIVWLIIIVSCIATSLFAQENIHATSLENFTSNGEIEKQATKTNSIVVLKSSVLLTPNEDNSELKVEYLNLVNETTFTVRTTNGDVYFTGYATENIFYINIKDFPSGTYYLIIDDKPEEIVQFQK